jgi:putative transposase
MLRKRLRHSTLRTTAAERKRLIKLGKAIGPGLNRLITIVTYGTYLNWIRRQKHHVPNKRIGRPRKLDAIRHLVLKLARENQWGYTRVLGELRKLGYTGISRQTVVNILKREGLDPWPKRGPGTWDELLKMHAETLWQCDFFSKRVITRRGLRQVFALVFINIATRRVWVSPSIQRPTVRENQQDSAAIEQETGRLFDCGRRISDWQARRSANSAERAEPNHVVGSIQIMIGIVPQSLAHSFLVRLNRGLLISIMR